MNILQKSVWLGFLFALPVVAGVGVVACSGNSEPEAAGEAGAAGEGGGGASGAEAAGAGEASGEGGSSEAGAAGTGEASGAGGGAKNDPIPLGLNDVSVLYPQPTNVNKAGYLRASDTGARGVLLPKEVFDAIPTFPVTPTDGLDYTRMRALSLRFDACGGSHGACLPEIRVIMQPLNSNGSARDSALHLFYRLDNAVISGVIDGLRKLRGLAPEAAVGAPLDVHPAIVAQGANGAYGTALRELVLAHVGEENLVRVTFFLRAPPINEVWFFGGLERKDGKFAVLNIAEVGAGNQRVILTSSDTSYEYALTPVESKPEDGRVLLSSAAAEAASAEEREAAFRSFLRIENPLKYVPDDLPCAGCHVSSFVKAEATRRFGFDAATFDGDVFKSTRNLESRGGSATNASSLRAFGWFKGEPMISQRTINDSAAVVDYIEATFPTKADP